MIDVLKGLAGSFGACVFFAALFHSPRRCVVSASLVGMAGYGVYLAVAALFSSVVGANFIAALVVAALAELLARVQKAPAIIFALIGIIPLVPGAGLYRTMLALVLKSYGEAAAIGVETVLSAGSIALGIAVVTVFTRAQRGRGFVR